MATNPIGITFLPSDENQALGPQRGQMEGDLGQAFKILSLRLPRIQGAHAIAPPDLLNAPGASGQPGGMNPQAAIFDALLKAMQGQGGGGMGPMATTPIGIPQAPAPPRVIAGGGVNSPGPSVDRTQPGDGNRGMGAPTFSGGPMTRRRF